MRRDFATPHESVAVPCTPCATRRDFATRCALAGLVLPIAVRVGRSDPLRIAGRLPIPRAMGSHARVKRTRRASIAVVVLALLACAIATAQAAAPAAQPTRAQVLRTKTDAQLADLYQRWDGVATRIGSQLLADDSHRDELLVEQDVAQEQLAAFLADAYKGGDTGGLLAEVLASGSLQEATDRVHVAEIVTSHHSSLLRQLNRAEAELEVSEFERSQLIAELSAAQAIAADVVPIAKPSSRPRPPSRRASRRRCRRPYRAAWSRARRSCSAAAPRARRRSTPTSPARDRR
jgi:hypothetical protein